jgi:nitrogen fixation NifU-like protein
MHSPKLLDHFEHPRNAGLLDGADAVAKLQNPACGDTVQLMAKVAGGRIEQIQFLARGCVASVACASALTELVAGRTPSEASSISRNELLTAVGGLPPASMHATHLALDTLKALLEKLGTKL